MFRKKAIYMLVTFLSIIVLSFVGALLVPKLLQSASPCTNTIIDQQLSPDKSLKVVVFARDCGATTGFSTHVTLLPVSEDLRNNGGNLFVADTNHGRIESAHWGGPRVDIHWINDKSISISFDQNARVFKKQDNVLGINMTYNPY
jgi:hypothetical protein